MNADDQLGGSRDERRSRLRPAGEKHHQRPFGEVIDDASQQIHRGAIRPVQIVHDDQERFVLQTPLDQCARRQRDLAMQLLGLEVPGLGVFHAEHVAEHGGDRSGLVGPSSERHEAVRELLPSDVERVGRVDLVRFAEERPEDAVGRLTQR